jgi:integrase
MRILEAFEGDYLEPVIILSAFCGLRKEEALALDWADISEDGTVQITRAWTASGQEIDDKGTKTHECRTAYLSGWALERMCELKYDRIGPICATVTHGKKIPGNRCHPQVATRHFRRVIERADIRYLPISKLRHTNATLALSLGIDVALVSKMLGHKRVSTTVDRYIKPLESAKAEATARLADAIMSQKLPKDSENSQKFPRKTG